MSDTKEIPPRLTVAELINHLSQFDGTMEVIEKRYSDWQHMRLEDWVVERGVEREDKNWITSYHYTMGKRDQARAKNYLLFQGN